MPTTEAGYTCAVVPRSRRSASLQTEEESIYGNSDVRIGFIEATRSGTLRITPGPVDGRCCLRPQAETAMAAVSWTLPDSGLYECFQPGRWSMLPRSGIPQNRSVSVLQQVGLRKAGICYSQKQNPLGPCAHLGRVPRVERQMTEHIPCTSSPMLFVMLQNKNGGLIPPFAFISRLHDPTVLLEWQNKIRF